MNHPSASPFSQPGAVAPLEVLVVDDDGPNRLLVVRWLERSGLCAAQAQDGREALELLRADPGRFGAVVLDWVMPVVTGDDVLAAMQEDPVLRAIPVVMLTAHVQEESEIVGGLRRGAADYVAKPFRGPLLAAKVQVLVQRRQHELELERRLRRAESLGLVDGLTGLGNRRQFDIELAREASFATRHRAPLAVLWVTLDDQRAGGEPLAPGVREAAICWAAETLSSALRRSDRAFRVDVDVFAVLLRGLDRSAAVCAARRFVNARVTWAGGEPAPLQASVGVAAADASNDYDVTELPTRAERALQSVRRLAEGRVAEEG